MLGAAFRQTGRRRGSIAGGVGTRLPMPSRNKAAASREADRYKKAATDALTLLDWCIEYFADNRQGKVAQQLARNRSHIRELLKGGSSD